MLLEISLSSNSKSIEPFCRGNEINCYIYKNVDIESSREYFNYFSQTPIVTDSSGVFVEWKRSPFKSEQLFLLQNEVSGFCLDFSSGAIRLLIFSAKLARPRLFYLFSGTSLYLSTDVRELIRFSSALVDLEAAFSIVKFGEIPEGRTIISGVICVPVGCFFELNEVQITKGIMSRGFDSRMLQRYLRISFEYSGGNLNKTKEKLQSNLAFLSKYSPCLLLSGGVDSSLLNFLFNSVVDSSYEAAFMHFDDCDKELDLVRKSVRGTKAKLDVVKLDSMNLINDFESSIRRIIYPVYDNGSALSGEIFRSRYLGNESIGTFVDGTLADSLYGVKNYNFRLPEGRQQPEWLSRCKENVFGRLQLIGLLKGHSKPRDSFVRSEFVQDLLWYSGPFANIWCAKAKFYTQNIEKQFEFYNSFLATHNRLEYWPQYTVQKMLFYAAKQTTVKTYDLLLPHQTYFPFMFPNIIADQGLYSWDEKSKLGIVKYPLKRLLESYIDKDFSRREKIGLQSQTIRWINDPSLKPYFSELVRMSDGIAAALFGDNRSKLVRHYQKDSPLVEITSIILSLSVIQRWMDINRVKACV